MVGDVEATDAFDLVAEELNTVGVVVGEGKHVDQTATDGKLSRLHHEIDVLKLVVVKQVGEEIEVDLLADLKLKGVLGQEFTGEDLLT